ncbi:hypothetical protein [Solidesulfovibrio sp. C21]|uniref:hypothetical protein n=1 Tax=Solidesulfovibrio sp. C21 TaxID=3398613 RepID=UPI0039FD0642
MGMGFDNVSRNAAEFSTWLNAVGEEYEQNFDKLVRKVLFDLWRMVAEGTPVDTGRARASWALDTDWSAWQLPEGDYREAIQANIGAAISKLPQSDLYVLYNNLEYIEALEEGHSQQAPSGFVALALAAITDKLREAAKALGFDG